MNLQELTDFIIQAAQGVVDEQGLESEGPISAETRLFGSKGLLDSLALVSLVIGVEQGIEEKFGVRIELADDKALSQKNSPYRSVGTLAAYAMQQYEAQRVAS